MGLFDAFFGDSQREDISGASEEAMRRYRQALSQATGTTREYLDKSLGFLQPDIEAGAAGRGLLMDALGLNGPEAQQGYYSGFQTDPGFQATQQAGVDAIEKSRAARGLLRSGGSLRSLFDYGQKGMFGQFQDRLNRLQGFLPLGTQASTASAGLTSDAGNRIADMQFGTGQLFANNAINTGNAMAASRSTPINNLIGLLTGVGSLAKGFSGFGFGAK